ncbi:homoserine dehydrogenase [Terribacillus saccharophilus]|uniref:homoserine dehydrogenase n=1 Tax=Terribacillus saccharophilus TaxID=361277 RepID=UPI000BA7AFDE|nr:homoserine dehydrogenase [Terribacillus saccharophilus]PAF23068.1 homoserine dehydrogenase [Terribacillus saccharophilus]
MDYTKLLDYDKKIKLGIVGASQGFGYTSLVQLKNVNQIDVRIVCSIDIEASYNALIESGYNKEKIVICHNAEEMKRTDESEIIVVDDYKLVLESGISSVLEATGNMDVGTYIAENALTHGINVYMVSKETDSFSGTYFNQLAHENNTVYALVNGDQPRNLVDLYSWGKLLGLNIVAAGKSSEYDFVFDRDSGKLTYTDGKEVYHDKPEIMNAWEYEDTSTLQQRFESLKELTGTIAADVCEINLVSNVTGLLPAAPGLNYPIAKVNELAEIFVPKKDGGILDRSGVVDVFYQLREKNEPSFAGGVFIVFELTNNEIMVDLLRGKGHIISKSGKYGCIYQPYHMMGLEAPLSIILGERLGIGTRHDTRQVSVMAGVAEEDLKAGNTFTVYGHHHEIKDVKPQLFERNEAKDAVPFYLLNNITLKNDVNKGEVIGFEDIEVDSTQKNTFDVYQKGLSLEVGVKSF